jgi:cohesin loading factor subunit SCC2
MRWTTYYHRIRIFLPIFPSDHPTNRLTMCALLSLFLANYSHCFEQSARELTAATCAQEFALALNQCDNVIAQREEVSDYNSPLYTNTWSLAKRLKTAMRDVWNEGSNDVFDVGSDRCFRSTLIRVLSNVLCRSEADVRRVDALSEEIGSSRGLSLAFEPILNVVLSALDATAVFMRTKALRALGQIVTSDPTVLNKVRSLASRGALL